MQKTIIFAIFTLLLAVATLVTNVLGRYADRASDAVSATPAQSERLQPARAPVKAPVRGQTMQAALALEIGSL